jgi:2-polyprenyl-3-methyl-5-hydroxy-6-metoxy-1,4-benzoquinol methylase
MHDQIPLFEEGGLFDERPQLDRQGRARVSLDNDTTELDVEVNESYWAHRDLLAHTFRWQFVGRLMHKGARVLDFGSGSDMPLGKMLQFGHGASVPELYVAVDYGSFKREHLGKRTKRAWEGNHRQHFDATNGEDCRSLWAEYGQFDIITSFEVVEHINPKEKVVPYLQNAFELLKDDGRMYLSTPVVDQASDGTLRRASNHIHEFSIPELQRVVEHCGFEVVDRFGTFANYHTIKNAVSQFDRQLYERLRQFYGDDVLACYLAPAFPELSRNQFLVLKKRSSE